jgi:hypothetical protein
VDVSCVLLPLSLGSPGAWKETVLRLKEELARRREEVVEEEEALQIEQEEAKLKIE